jgi:polyvinyl alcohol dehydrogenase (cytochrome)
MPQPPDAPLTSGEIAALQQWISAGALPDAHGCAVVTPMVPPPAMAGSGGAGGASGGGGSGVAGAAGSAGSGGAAGGGQAGAGGATAPGTGWAMFGRDLANSRSNPDETMLSAQSVPRLRELWRWNGASTTSTPAVVDGVVYLPSWDGAVHALRAEDGMKLWAAMLPDLIDSSPCVSDRAVYVADDAGSVHALARDSGRVLWSKRVEPHPEAHLWSSPLFIAEANLIVVGVASGEEVMGVPMPRTFRGSVVALDATSGEIEWQLYTTPGDATSGPGIAVWSTAAVDTARKTLYIGTGNNYEAPTGKYADSLLAIDYEKGTLLWATQFTPDDVFVVGGGATGPDYDIGSSANLFTAGGKDLVGIGVKSGIYYALDRETGVMQWMAMITPGSPLGGVMSASAYANGMVYVASNRFGQGMTRTVALDASNGAVKWEHDEASVTYGGVAHANGVAYVATNAGTIWALDAQSGAELWSAALPDATAGSPTVADGTLFVPWGYQWTLRGGMPGTGGLIAYGL